MNDSLNLLTTTTPSSRISMEGKAMLQLSSMTVTIRRFFYAFFFLISVSGHAATYYDTDFGLTVPATSNGNHTATFNWLGGLNIGNYYLEEQINGGSWNTVYTSSEFLEHEFSVSLSNRATGNYAYRVKFQSTTVSITHYGFSKTVIVSASPGVPSSISTSPVADNDGAFTVNWGTASGTVTSYKLEQQVNGGSWSQIYSGTSRSKAFSGLADGSYKYRVKACNSIGCSAYRTASAYVVTSPTSSTTSAIHSIRKSHKIDWAAATGSFDAYQLYQKINDAHWTQVYEGLGLSATFTDLADGHYQYWVRACNTEGGNTTCSGYQASDRLTLSYIDTPTDLTVPSGDADGAYTISWQPGQGTATSYTLQEQLNGGAWTTVQDTVGTTYSTSGKTNNQYSYQVRGCNAGGCTDYSAVQTVNVLLAGQPGPITGPSTLEEENDFTLIWGAALGSLTHYELEEQVSGGSWSQVYSGTDLTLAFTDHNFGTYNYRARACNAIACGSYTGTKTVSITFTIPPQAAPNPFDVMSNLANLVSQADIAATDTVGSVGGSFRVDESGAATYSIPIATVKGTAGVVPQISLNYSSQAGNGLMGKGWSIGGLSAVTRCRKTLSQDKSAKAITWSANDRFCLDGQRLLKETGASYGAVGATYKTEIDSFAKVTSVGGSAGHPDYWEVERKDGSVSTYGGSGNIAAEQEARNASGTVTTKTLTWALKKFEDSVGNKINFNYIDDDGGHRIDNIQYAYGLSSTHGAHLDFNYEARADDISGYVAGYQFKNNRRLKTIKSLNGSNVVRQYNLAYKATPSGSTANKESKLASVQECVASQCLPKTTFDWESPSINFGPRVYSQTNAINTEIPLIGKPGDFNGDGKMDMVYAQADVQDSDIDYELQHSLSNGTRLVPQSSLSITLPDEDHGQTFAWHVIDYNNDGYSDVIRGGGSGNWRVHLSNGTKLTNTSIDTGVPTSSSLDASFLDLNSDGLPDFIRDKGNNAYGLRFMEQVTQSGSLVTRFSSQEITLDLLHSQPVSGTSDEYFIFKGFGSNPITGDFNGDGNTDFVGEMDYAAGGSDTSDCIQGGVPAYACIILRNYGLSTNNLGIYLSDGQGGYTFNKRLSGTDLEDIRVIDVNADGLTDYLQRNTSNQWKLYLSTGTGFVLAHNVSTIPNDTKMQFLDYNEDGYQDLIYPNGSNYYARVFNPETQTFKSAAAINITYGGNTTNETLYFMDINGDGHQDAVRYYVPGAWGNNQGNADAYVRLSNANGEYNTVVTSITNGLAAETNITYAPLKNHTFYTKATDANAINWGLPSGNHSLGKFGPLFDFAPPSFAVSQVESSAPKAGSSPNAVDSSAKSSISYSYEGAKLQASGRGFLGFEKIKTKDEQTGVQTTTTYRQDWPFIGHPLKTEVRTSQGHLLSKAENTWKLKGYASSWANTAKNSGTKALGALQPYIFKSVEKSYALEGNGTLAGALLQTVTTDNVYDDYGNPTSIKVTTNGGGKNFQKVTTNNYLASGLDATYSQELGRLAQTTVISKRDENGDSGYELTSTRNSSFSYYTSGILKGLLATETIEPSNAQLTLTTTHSYDNFGNKVRAATTDANSNTRCDVNTAIYDASGRYVDTNYDCLGRKVSEVVSRNEYGEPLEVKTYLDTIATNSVSTYYVYTPRGIRYLEASDAGAWKITALRDCSVEGCPAGAVYYAKVTSAGGGKSREYFDLLGRSVLKVSVGFGGQWIASANTEYNNLGRVKRKSEPYYYYGSSASQWSTMTYDKLGRVTQLTLPDASTGTTVFNGYTTVTTNNLGHSKTEIKNTLGETTQVTDHLGGSAYYYYDAQGNMTSMVDNASNTSTISYDVLGRKTAMNDPDKGTWSYAYNGFGELVSQTDAKGQVSTMTYDTLGRMLARIDYRVDTTVEGNTAWAYDTAPNGLGQLDSVEDNISGYLKAVEYDSLGRTSKTVTSLGVLGADGDHYEKVTYDQFGRTYQVFDAARNDDTYTDNGIETRYNQYGYQYQLVDATYINDQPRSTYQEVLTMNARGQVTSERLGNNATTVRTYNNQTGRVSSIKATNMLGTSGDIQDLSYQWDTVGNLTNRIEQSGSKDLTENFLYDGLNRLTSYAVVGETAKTISYDLLGNITNKSDVGAYTYGAGNAGPHAVTDAGGTTYSYDANGNNTSSTDGNGNIERSIAYTTFDKAHTVTKGAHTTTFAYGADRARYKRTDTNVSGTKTTLYIGSVEKITNIDGTQEVKRTIGGVAIITLNQNSLGVTQSETTNYLYKDHLGSLDVITDATGAIATNGGEMSFDAWGARRDAVSWEDISDQIVTAGFGVFSNPVTTRGFTGHEMADEVGIIHMNGRIYDPKLGRFLQADPIIQEPTNSQSLNRYSYTYNNPLNATDPSGYLSFSSIIDGIVAIVAVAIEVVCGGCGAGLTLMNVYFSSVSPYLHAAEAAFNSFSSGNFFQGALQIATAFTGRGAVGEGGNDWANFAATTAGRFTQKKDQIDRRIIRQTTGTTSTLDGPGFLNASKSKAFLYAISASAEVVKGEEDKTLSASEIPKGASACWYDTCYLQEVTRNPIGEVFVGERIQDFSRYTDVPVLDVIGARGESFSNNKELIGRAVLVDLAGTVVDSVTKSPLGTLGGAVLSNTTVSKLASYRQYRLYQYNDVTYHKVWPREKLGTYIKSREKGVLDGTFVENKPYLIE
ncbi:MAG: RHS repeat-associated core domain-containing protein [Porticoccus sp.]|nr:RHS repeat-associated core domain-containing protein [Porticoccus sp.]